MKKLILLLFLVLMLVQPIFAVDNVEVIYTDAVRIDQHKEDITERLENIALSTVLVIAVIVLVIAVIFAIQGNRPIHNFCRHWLGHDDFGRRYEPPYSTQNRWKWAPRREQYNSRNDISKDYYY